MYSTSYHRPLSHTSSYVSPSLRLTGYTSSLPPSSYRYTSPSYSTLPSSSSKQLISNLSYSRPSTTSSYRPSYSYTSTIVPERRWRSQSRSSDLSSTSVGSDRTSVWRSSSVGSSLTSRSGSTSSLTSIGRESWSPRTSRFSSTSELKVPANDSSPNTDNRIGKTGLHNLGNTCFMNAVLQSLCHTAPLVTYCTRGSVATDINYQNKTSGNLMNAFAGLTKAMWKNGDCAANPESLRRELQKYAPQFLGDNQQDAQECLVNLLNGMHQEINRVKGNVTVTTSSNRYLTEQQKAQEAWFQYLKKDDSKITDLFAGQHKNVLTCLGCNNTSVTYDPFMDLSLPIPEGKINVTLLDCLNLYSSPELLEGHNRPECERCRRKTETTKQLQINLFPKILVLHLKRFSAGNYHHKLSTMVDFPLTNLDLSQVSSNPYSSSSGPYDLYAVVNHTGTGTGSGHYMAYCKSPITGEWNIFNDARVSKVNRSSLVSSTAYLLFYEKRS